MGKIETLKPSMNFAGRSKNVWESPKGCLMFSFTLQVEDARVVPLIQYTICLAVTEAVKSVCDKKVCVLWILFTSEITS